MTLGTLVQLLLGSGSNNKDVTILDMTSEL